MKPLCQRSGLAMARKKQKIEIVVHMDRNVKEIFDSESVNEFWTEKIAERLRKGCISNEDLSLVLDRIVKKGKCWK